MKLYILLFLSLATLETMSQSKPSQFNAYALRLTPHQDVKESLIQFAKENNLKAACIVTAVGSLEQYHIRFANQEKGALRTGHFEVVSLTGTFSASSSHLHISVSDKDGATVGGHLLGENKVYTTLEIIIAELTDLEFQRATDPTYGYQELVIRPRSSENP